MKRLEHSIIYWVFMHSYFYILQHTIFGEVAEGLDVLQKINELYTDENFRPFQDVM